MFRKTKLKNRHELSGEEMKKKEDDEKKKIFN